MRLGRDERVRPHMAQSPRGGLASVRSFIGPSKQYIFLTVYSNEASLHPIVFRESNWNYTPEKNVDAGKATRPLLRMFPNRADVNRTGSIDPEVIVTVDRLAWRYVGGALRGCAGAVSEG